MSYLDFLSTQVKEVLYNYCRHYEVYATLYKDCDLSASYTSIVTYGDVRLTMFVREKADNPWNAYERMIQSGSPEMVKFFLDAFGHTRINFQACFESIGKTGYIHLLDTIKSYGSFTDYEIQQSMQNGLRLIISNSCNRTNIYRIAVILGKLFTGWEQTLILQELSMIKLFKQHLGTYPSARINYMSSFWEGQEDEVIRYFYFDEDGLQVYLDRTSLQYLIGSLYLSDALVIDLLNKYPGQVHETFETPEPARVTDKQRQSRKELLLRYFGK